MTDPFGRYRLANNIRRNREREADRETLKYFQAARSDLMALAQGSMLEPFDSVPIAVHFDTNTRH